MPRTIDFTVSNYKVHRGNEEMYIPVGLRTPTVKEPLTLRAATIAATMSDCKVNRGNEGIYIPVGLVAPTGRARLTESIPGAGETLACGSAAPLTPAFKAKPRRATAVVLSIVD